MWNPPSPAGMLSTPGGRLAPSAWSRNACSTAVIAASRLKSSTTSLPDSISTAISVILLARRAAVPCLGRFSSLCWYMKHVFPLRVKRGLEMSRPGWPLTGVGIYCFMAKHARNASLAAGRNPPAPVEPSRAGLAATALAGRGAPQAVGVPPTRHPGALRGLPVARAGGAARGRRRDPDPRSADREPERGRRAPVVPQAARPRLQGSSRSGTARCCRASTRSRRPSA